MLNDMVRDAKDSLGSKSMRMISWSFIFVHISTRCTEACSRHDKLEASILLALSSPYYSTIYVSSSEINVFVSRPIFHRQK